MASLSHKGKNIGIHICFIKTIRNPKQHLTGFKASVSASQSVSELLNFQSCFVRVSSIIVSIQQSQFDVIQVTNFSDKEIRVKRCD